MQLSLLKGEAEPVVFARVISGGQTGVDVAALRAARAFGIPTGGRMPYGFKTQDGPRPEYATIFGVEEDECSDYPPRTEVNVRDSDATLRIARDFGSAGERCTLRAIKKYDRPFLDVRDPLRRVGRDLQSSYLSETVRWIVHLRLKLERPIVLNVAGNSERTAPGIGTEAVDFLDEVFGFLLVRPSNA